MTKKKNKKQTTSKTVKRKSKHFDSHYLALALIAVLLLEGFLFSYTSHSDWQAGVAILDVSTAYAQTTSDINSLLQPVKDVMEGVNQFYQLSATAMTQLLDLSGADPIGEVRLFTDGVNDFYQQASIQLADLLEPHFQTFGNVAGASIVR